MPDIDHKGSTIGHKFKISSTIISKLCGHRGLIHAPIIHIILTYILLLLANSLQGYVQMMYISFVFGLFLGVMSHLFLDSLTTMGIPLLLPFTSKKYRLCNIKTKKYEHLVSLCIVIVTFVTIKLIV